MEGVRKVKPDVSIYQRNLSFLLVGLMLIIAGAILWLQSEYDPALWREQSVMPSAPPKSSATHPKGLVPLSAAEKYGADTLSDKINGKADLYLSAGFRHLESQRFSLVKDKAQWMERYVYDMGGHPNAFAVFSAQRRSESKSVDITPHAYLSANGLFLVHGPYYLEIVASEASESMQSHITALGKAFVKSHHTETAKLNELDLFAADHQVPDSTKLIAQSAFGIENLDWIYTTDYARDQAQAIAFIAKRSSEDEARASAEAFISFWNEYGGEAVKAPEQLKGAGIVLILDNYEIVMVQGPYFFGVHEATSIDFGRDVLMGLQKAVAPVVP